MAVISAEDAIAYDLVGPNLRASGVQWDVRRDEPYSIYPEFEFDVPVGTAPARRGRRQLRPLLGAHPRDAGERARFCASASQMLPEGPAIAKVPRKFKPPAGEVYARVEAPRGDMGFYVVSDGTENPYRVRVRTGSFTAMAIIDKLSRGIMLADLVALIGSLDVDGAGDRSLRTLEGPCRRLNTGPELIGRGGIFAGDPTRTIGRTLESLRVHGRWWLIVLFGLRRSAGRGDDLGSSAASRRACSRASARTASARRGFSSGSPTASSL